MPGKVPTPGMPAADRRDSARRGEGETDGLIPRDRRDAGGGGPVGPKDADGDFHGGQTGAAYHGCGQLGEQDVEGQDNANAPGKDP